VFIHRDEAILHCGAPTTKNAIEMEGQVFSKAKSKVSTNIFGNGQIKP